MGVGRGNERDCNIKSYFLLCSGGTPGWMLKLFMYTNESLIAHDAEGTVPSVRRCKK